MYREIYTFKQDVIQLTLLGK